MKIINKISIFLIAILCILVFKEDVYADTCAQYNNLKTMYIDVYIEDYESNEFNKYKMPRSYIDNGIVSLFNEYNYIYTDDLNYTYYKSNLVQVVDDNYMLTIPQKEGYNFDGWYLDKDFKTKINDTNIPKFDLNDKSTLYGRWTKENIVNENRIYEFGKDDIYIILLDDNYSISHCVIRDQYIYIPKNNYISNLKGKFTSFPSLPNLENKDFYGWIGYNSDGKIVEINKVEDIKNVSRNGVVSLYHKYVEKTEEKDNLTDNEIKKENNNTTENNSKEKSTKQNNAIMYICIGSVTISLIIVVSIFCVRKNKTKAIEE